MSRGLIFSSLLHALFGSSAAYYCCVLNPMEQVILSFINASLSRYSPHPSPSAVTWVWAALNSTLTITWLLGAICIRPLTDHWGRRVCCVVIQPLVLIVGSVCMALSKCTNSFELLIFGHILTGLSMVFNSFTILYIAECSPAKWRSFSTNVTFMGNSLWWLLGAVAGLPQTLGTEELWPYAMALPSITSILYLLLGFLFLPESPKHLYITRQDVAGARKAVRFYHGDAADMEAVEHQMLMEDQLAQSQHDAVSLRQVWETRHLRIPFAILCLAGLAFNAGAGPSVVRPYSTQMMRLTFGMGEAEAALQTVLCVFVPTFLLSVAAPGLVWLMPRRRHLFIGIAATEIGLMLIVLTEFMQQYSIASIPAVGVVGMSLSMSASAAAIGPVVAALPAELVPQKARALAALVRLLPSGLHAIAQSQLYPILSESVGAYALPIVTALDLPVWILLVIFLPETKGTEVEQLNRRWREDEEEIPLL